MKKLPCDDCANLIGTVSAASPHAELKVQAVKPQSRTSTGDNRAVFYRCRKCQAYLLRDLHRDDPSAQWAWVKSTTPGNASTLETHK